MNLLPIALSLAAIVQLAACVTPVLPTSPAVVADATTSDERAALAVEVLYRAAGGLLEAAIDGGRLKGEAAERADRVDAKAAFYVAMAREAYDTGNSVSYAEAIRKAAGLIEQMHRLAEARP